MIVKGRIKLNWVTSIHPQAYVLHRVDHRRTKIVLRDDYLSVRVYTQCGATLNPSNVLFVSDYIAHQWSMDYYPAVDYVRKYGQRTQCEGCFRFMGVTGA